MVLVASLPPVKSHLYEPLSLLRPAIFTLIALFAGTISGCSSFGLQCNTVDAVTAKHVSSDVLAIQAVTFHADTQQTRQFGHNLIEPDEVFSDDFCLSVPEIHRQNLPMVDADKLSLFERVVTDHQNYYSSRNLGILSVGFAGGAILANSSLDEQIAKHFSSSVNNVSSDEWFEMFHAPKELGNGMYTLPVFAAAWGIGSIFDESEIGSRTGEWGERSLRAFLVGAPPLILLQKATGAGRPNEGGSSWNFWHDNNGVSGHAFMGVLPFLTAAQVTDEPLPKFALYAASTLVPLSRINDGAHYTSQAFLGWVMAWSATMAVDATQDQDNSWRVLPLVGPGFSGMGFEHRW